MVVLFLGSDQLCRYDIQRRLPPYPGAEIVSSEHDFLRPQALGETSIVLTTPDNPETVREWYRQLNLTLLEQNRLRGLAAIDRRFEADATGGTTIIYNTSCGL